METCAQIPADIALWLVPLLVTFVALLPLAMPSDRERAISTTQVGAAESLKYVSDWAKWMAAIQTAALGFLALAVLDDKYLGTRCLNQIHVEFAYAAFAFMGAALFANAWTLSSLPSQVLRIFRRPRHQNTARYAFDVYAAQIYAGLPRRSPFTLGYLLVVKHWLWALGVLSVGLFCFAILLAPPEARQSCEQAMSASNVAIPMESVRVLA
jgi:hypothetical protein